LPLKTAQQAFVAPVLLSLGVTSGCMVVDALSVSTLVVAGQAMTSRSEDITQYDVYQGQAIWQGYWRDAVYRLKGDVFYGRAYSSGLGVDDLIRPGAALATIPRSIDSYLADPAKWPNIKGIVPAGAKLRVSRILYVQDLNLHDFYYIAVFHDGPIAGHQVLLNEISLAKMGLGKPRFYDPELLERVSSGQ
jgi:hypothetical protein